MILKFFHTRNFANKLENYKEDVYIEYFGYNFDETIIFIDKKDTKDECESSPKLINITQLSEQASD